MNREALTRQKNLLEAQICANLTAAQYLSKEDVCYGMVINDLYLAGRAVTAEHKQVLIALHKRR